jgi:hypothetical protein
MHRLQTTMLAGLAMVLGCGVSNALWNLNIYNGNELLEKCGAAVAVADGSGNPDLQYASSCIGYLQAVEQANLYYQGG